MSYAQQRLNFDFEKESVEGIVRPWGWSLDAWGVNVFSLDSTTVMSGTYSLRMQSDSVSTQLPALQANLEPYRLLGKRVELKGYLKSQLQAGNAFISYGYATVDENNNYSDSSAVIFTVAENTNDWSVFQASFIVPQNAISVFVKIGLEGTGAIWYDDLWLELDGDRYEDLPVATAFSKTEMQWVDDQVVAFNDSNDPSQQSFDFSFFAEVIGDARIVALGESTHGTSDFFRLKHEVFKYLVEHHGFRVFALEDHMLACERVNRYILGQVDLSTEKAMSQLFAVWFTEEVAHLIDWMKQWNEAKPDDPVYFTGFDIQNYQLPLAAAREYLAQNHPALLDDLEGYEAFAKNIHSSSDSLKENWLDKISQLREELMRSSPQSGNDVEGLQHVRLLQQYTENVLKGHWSFFRDEAMANNLEWLAKRKYPGERIFVWAHDVHVSKSNHPTEHYNLSQGIAMGHFLDEKFGSAYKAYGISTYSGSFLALKSYTNHERIHAPLYPAPVGSMEHALHQISQQRKQAPLFLDFSLAPDWVKRPLPFRFANHVSIDYGFFTRISLPYQFDGIFFMDDTGPSKYLKAEKTRP